MPFLDPSLSSQKLGLLAGHPTRLQERLIATLKVDSGHEIPVVESSPRCLDGSTPRFADGSTPRFADGSTPRFADFSTSRPTDGDEVPFRTQRTLSSSNLLNTSKESNGLSDECNTADKKVGDDAAEVAVELKAAKSLLEIYKQRSGDLVHANEDLRNQLMALQLENATLKIQNEELRSQNEALIKANETQIRVSENASSAAQAERDPIDK